ncbi:PLP-dependent aminotransferase family protein [Paenibacillus sp. FSL K6-1096]|uniref:MocR-like pyridoxine biosynthesis transcription factor PdxR n=1 Tax=Paenibacillus sp. FSL K6-1096 TaxID=2921460 RepID=UPI0030EE2521
MITINKQEKTPIYIQIYRQIREDIINGSLPAHSRLKPIRVIADELKVGINTIKRAYTQLVVEGFLENTPRTAYEVVDLKKFKPKRLKNSKIAIDPETEEIPAVQHYKYDFTYQKQSIELFPLSSWRKYTTEALMGYDNEKLGCYNDQKGEVELRKEIKKYLNLSRGVKCNIEQIIVCCGIQDSIERICRILPRTTVGVEQPGLPLWGHIFRGYGFSTIPLNVYPEHRLQEDLEDSNARIAVTTPSHQFPTGYTMSLSERLQLIQWAENNDGIIIEDDYDCEFRYDSQPVSAMQSIDDYGRIIYLGTFSKILIPGLRLNFMVLPKRLLSSYHKVYGEYPTAISWLSQKVMYFYMNDGSFDKHIRRARYVYKEKYITLLSACKELLGDQVDIIGSDAGLHILLRINRAASQEELINRAAQKNVRVYSTREYWDSTGEHFENLILLGFSIIKQDEIYAGIQQLRTAWQDYL